MNLPLSTRALVGVCLLSPVLAGCSFLKPSAVTPRSFVLTSLPAAPAQASESAGARGGGAGAGVGAGVGVAQVSVAHYLLPKPMVMRQESNEIVYLESAQWAERVDSGLQRVLAANLGMLLATEQVHLSTWRADEVSVVVHVNVERFDVDNRGEGVLTAWWNVGAPGGAAALASGKFSATHSGPSPDKDPQGAVSSMSALAADFSRELARAIQSTH